MDVRNAAFSFARQSVIMPSGTVIPAGLNIAADMTFLTISFQFSLNIDTTGFELYAEVKDVTVSWWTGFVVHTVGDAVAVRPVRVPHALLTRHACPTAPI